MKVPLKKETQSGNLLVDGHIHGYVNGRVDGIFTGNINGEFNASVLNGSVTENTQSESEADKDE